MLGKGRQRLGDLEAENSARQAEIATLQAQVRFFYQIAAAAGASLREEQEHDEIPLELLAAAADPRSGFVPVRLPTASGDVVAVIGGDGDPGQIWAAVQRLGRHLRSVG